MPKNRYPHVQREITRHGTVVWYFRKDRGGKRIRLPADYGSKEFLGAYNAALAGQGTPEPAKNGNGTVAWLLDRYKASSAWSSLSATTRMQRDQIYLKIVAVAGHEPFKSVTAKTIRVGRERRKDTPSSANNYLKAVRALFKWAVKEEYIAANPTLEVERLRVPQGGHEPWTDADVAAFESRWPIGTRQRVAMHVLMYTGLRRGDAFRLGRQHVSNGIIRIKTEKTNEPLFIAVAPNLAKTLAAGPTGDLAFITSESGKQYTKESFGNWFGDACRAAGLVRKSAHGLRKYLATTAANAGATELELQALFGWRDGETSAIYTRKAARERLAKQASEKLGHSRTYNPGKGLDAIKSLK